MGHCITALITKAELDPVKVKEYDLFVVKADDVSIIGLDVSHSDYWSDKLKIDDVLDREIILDCELTHYIASDVIKDGRFALIETDYFGGMGDQAAVVYSEGNVVEDFGRAHSGPINNALKSIGVWRKNGMDEFDSIGLGKYRDFYQHYGKYVELV